MFSDTLPMEESSERRSSSLLSPFQTQLLGNQSSFRPWNKSQRNKARRRERKRKEGQSGQGLADFSLLNLWEKADADVRQKRLR